MACQVPAINGRDIKGNKRPQVLRVVPIEEMALMTFEIFDRGDRGLEALDHLRDSQPSELASGRDGDQIQSDIGRRRAVSDYGLGNLLKIVRRQLMVRGCDERLEKSPGLTGDEPEQPPVVRGKTA